MINVVTVHWQTPRWIEPQLGYLERSLGTGHRVFASLNGITDPGLRSRFHLAVDLEGTHAEKLNALAELAVAESTPEDPLVFLDGDAFPVRPLDRWIPETLAATELAAVRRDENLGDRQPHPCFAVTTCGFWAAVGGDWREGGTWVNSAGETTTDVGGTLLHQLEDRGVAWRPLLRTNTDDPDPLWFGVYDHRVYHHGAGFRQRISRVGAHAEATSDDARVLAVRGASLEGLASRTLRHPSDLARLRPRHLAQLPGATGVTIAKQRRRWISHRRARDAERRSALEAEVFEQLRVDPTFYRRFDDTPA